MDRGVYKYEHFFMRCLHEYEHSLYLCSKDSLEYSCGVVSQIWANLYTHHTIKQKSSEEEQLL